MTSAPAPVPRAAPGEVNDDVARPVIVGSASRDVALDDPRGWRLGGAATYAGLALARLGLRPRILLGGDADVATAEELELIRAAGGELVVAALARSPVFENREVHGVRSQLCLEPGDSLPVDRLPAAWRGATTWLLGPVAGELPASWAEVPPTDAFVALGWQGLLRDLRGGEIVTRRIPERTTLATRADLVVVSRQDLAPDTDLPALGGYFKAGARLVVTDGDAGGTDWRVRDGRAFGATSYRAIPSTRTVDPTGAGDAFLAGLVADRLGFVPASAPADGMDLLVAAAMGSLTVERLGVHGVPTAREVEARLSERPPPG